MSLDLQSKLTPDTLYYGEFTNPSLGHVIVTIDRVSESTATPIDFGEGSSTTTQTDPSYPVELTFSDSTNDPAIVLEHGQPDEQDVYQPIVNSRCSLFISEIIGEPQDVLFNDLFDVNDFGVVVRIFAENTLLDNNDLYWKGFVVGDLYEDNILTSGGTIEIQCYDGISTLENVSYQGAEDRTHIDTINTALEPVETEDIEFAVVMNYSYDNSANTTDRDASVIDIQNTLESFRNDDTDLYETNLEALRNVLNRHNVTLYQQSGQWIIRERYAIDQDTLEFPNDALIINSKTGQEVAESNLLKTSINTDLPEILFLPNTPNRLGIQRNQTVVSTYDFETEEWIANGGFEDGTANLPTFWDKEHPDLSSDTTIDPDNDWNRTTYQDASSYFEDLTETPDDSAYIQYDPQKFNGSGFYPQPRLIQDDYHRIPKTDSSIFAEFQFETGASENNVGVPADLLYRGDSQYKWSFAVPFNVTLEYQTNDGRYFVLRNSSSQGGNDNGNRVKLTQDLKGVDDETVKCEQIGVNGSAIQGTELMPEGAVLRAWREPTVANRQDIDVVEITLNEPLKVGATSFKADVEDSIPKDTEIEFYYWEDITEWENDSSPSRPRPRLLSGFNNSSTLPDNSGFTPHTYQVMMQTPDGTPVEGDPTLTFARVIPLDNTNVGGFMDEVALNNVSLALKSGSTTNIDTETFAIQTDKEGRTKEINKTFKTGAGPSIAPPSSGAIKTLNKTNGGKTVDGASTQMWVKYGTWDFTTSDVDPKENSGTYFTLNEWTVLRRLAYQAESTQRILVTADARSGDAQSVGMHFGYNLDNGSFLTSYFRHEIGSSASDVEIELTEHKNFPVDEYEDIDFVSSTEPTQTNIILDQRNIDGASSWIELGGRPTGLYSSNASTDGNPDTISLDFNAVTTALDYIPFDEQGGDIFGSVNVDGDVSTSGDILLTDSNDLVRSKLGLSLNDNLIEWVAFDDQGTQRKLLKFDTQDFDAVEAVGDWEFEDNVEIQKNVGIGTPPESDADLTITDNTTGASDWIRLRGEGGALRAYWDERNLVSTGGFRLDDTDGNPFFSVVNGEVTIHQIGPDPVGSVVGAAFNIGPVDGSHIEFDDNEMQKYNGNGDPATLFIQRDGAATVFGQATEKVLNANGIGINTTPNARLDIIGDGTLDLMRLQDDSGALRYRTSASELQMLDGSETVWFDVDNSQKSQTIRDGFLGINTDSGNVPLFTDVTDDGSWGLEPSPDKEYYIAGTRNGDSSYVYEFNTTGNRTAIGVNGDEQPGQAWTSDSRYALLGGGDLRIFDRNQNWAQVGQNDIIGSSALMGITLDDVDERVWVGGQQGNIHLLDIIDKTNPTETAFFETPLPDTGASGLPSITGVEYYAGTDTLFVTQRVDNVIYVFEDPNDLTTISATITLQGLTGSSGNRQPYRQLKLNDGLLWAVDSSGVIYKINPDTYVIEDQVATGFGGMRSIHFDNSTNTATVGGNTALAINQSLDPASIRTFGYEAPDGTVASQPHHVIQDRNFLVIGFRNFGSNGILVGLQVYSFRGDTGQLTTRLLVGDNDTGAVPRLFSVIGENDDVAASITNTRTDAGAALTEALRVSTSVESASDEIWALTTDSFTENGATVGTQIGQRIVAQNKGEVTDLYGALIEARQRKALASEDPFTEPVSADKIVGLGFGEFFGATNGADAPTSLRLIEMLKANVYNEGTDAWAIWDDTALGIKTNSDFITSANLEHPDWNPGVARWGITADGDADFRSITADQLSIDVFVSNLWQTLAGSDVLTKSSADLAEAYEIDSGTMKVERPADWPSGSQIFENQDIIRFRIVDRSGGGLSVTTQWAQVQSYSGETDGIQTYQVAPAFVDSASEVQAGLEVPEGSRVVNFGVEGDTVIERSVTDVASPFDRIYRWFSNANGDAPDPTLRETISQLGNISSIPSIPESDLQGIYSDSARFEGDLVIGSLDKTGDYLEYDGTDLTVTGGIVADDGDIGGWTIESNRLISQTANGNVIINSNDNLIETVTGTPATDGVAVYMGDLNNSLITSTSYGFGIHVDGEDVFFADENELFLDQFTFDEVAVQDRLWFLNASNETVGSLYPLTDSSSEDVLRLSGIGGSFRDALSTNAHVSIQPGVGKEVRIGGPTLLSSDTIKFGSAENIEVDASDLKLLNGNIEIQNGQLLVKELSSHPPTPPTGYVSVYAYDPNSTEPVLFIKTETGNTFNLTNT